MSKRQNFSLAITGTAIAFTVVGLTFHIPAGWFGLIGIAGWLLEHPMRRLSERLARAVRRLEQESVERSER